VSANKPEDPRDAARRKRNLAIAVGVGLFMALINILPTWVVMVGRQLIVALAGGGQEPRSRRHSGCPTCRLEARMRSAVDRCGDRRMRA